MPVTFTLFSLLLIVTSRFRVVLDAALGNLHYGILCPFVHPLAGPVVAVFTGRVRQRGRSTEETERVRSVEPVDRFYLS